MNSEYNRDLSKSHLIGFFPYTSSLFNLSNLTISKLQQKSSVK